jgi:hypothetical protein
VGGRQGVDRLVVCFRARSANTTFAQSQAKQTCRKSFWSLVPLPHAADRLASCTLWGKPLFVRRLTSFVHTHIYSIHETLVKLTIEKRSEMWTDDTLTCIAKKEEERRARAILLGI